MTTSPMRPRVVRFSSLQLKEIRQAINLADVIGRQVSLKMSGERLKGRCPFHDEKTPSFFVDAAQGRYFCFGCGVRGDIFDYLMNMEGITFPEAVERAAQEAGVDLHELDPHEEEALRKREARRSALYTINDKACAFFEEQLQSAAGTIARDYLTGRGISPEMCAEYRLGYAPDAWDSLVGIFDPKSELPWAVTTGLVRPRRQGDGFYDFYRHRVMFPIRDTSGRVRGFSSRILDPERKEGKYVNSPECEIFKKHLALFGLYEAKSAIRRKGTAILVEGNLDVITMAQAGLAESVAPLGTAITAQQIKLLTRFTKDVTVMFDGDDAGRAATKKAISLLIGAKLGGRVVFLPQGEDPDTYIKGKGIEEMEHLIEISQPPMEALFAMELPPISASTTEKLRSLTTVSSYFAAMSGPERDVYSQEISIRFGMDQKQVLEILSSARQSDDMFERELNQRVSPTPDVTVDPDMAALLHIAVLGFDNNSTLPQDQLSAIGNSFLNTAAIDLWRIMVTLPQPVSDETWRQLLGPYYAKFIEIKRSFLGPKEKPVELEARQGALGEVISTLRQRGLKHRAKLLDFAIQTAKKDGENHKIEALLKEKLALQRERMEIAQARSGGSL